MISLDTAKALKEAGWSKETEYIWRPHDILKEWQLRNRHVLHKEIIREFYPCPLLEELLADLPSSIYGGDKTFQLLKTGDRYLKYMARYDDIFDPDSSIGSLAVNPAEACAILWIELKQRGLVK